MTIVWGNYVEGIKRGRNFTGKLCGELCGTRNGIPTRMESRHERKSNLYKKRTLVVF